MTFAEVCAYALVIAFIAAVIGLLFRAAAEAKRFDSYSTQDDQDMAAHLHRLRVQQERRSNGDAA